jgi:Putative Zn-dependent protease, contains TPR repeats
MQAVLNGLTGAGLLIDGDRVSLLRADGEPSTTPGRFSDLPQVLGEARNVEFVNVSTANQALETLRRDHLREESLDLALILLDRDLSDETRAEAAEVLNEALDWDLRSWLEGVLYGAPLPAGADMAGALRHARGMAGTAVASMLSRLSDLRDVIQRVHEAWNSVCARDLPNPAARHEATVLAARNGVFRHLVHAAEGANYAEFRFVALKVLQPVTGHRQIVADLISELKLLPASRKATQRLTAEPEDARQLPSDYLRDAEHLSFDRTSVFEIVKRKKEAIVDRMRAADFALVGRLVDELIEYQLPLDRKAENASKSLCDLATEAKSLQLFELRLELARRAVGVRYQDGWAWAQVGDASLILNRFDDALIAYRHASEFGNDLFGRTGRAQVLLAMGRLNEALDAYDDAAREFPDNVVARNGRADVLKSIGRLDQALAAYDDTIREFPNDIFAKTGRAEVLKFMGRLDEALAAYDDTIRNFPDNVVAKNGRADVLKSTGRLDQALAAYDQTINEFPSNIFAKNGRAEVLKSLGRLDEALTAYDAIGLEFPNDVVTKNGRAEVLKSMGRLDEALAAYDAIGREFPNDAVARTGRAEVLKSLGRLDEALAAYDQTINEFPSNIFAKNGRAEVLKSLGRLDEALTAYDAIGLEFPNDVVAKSGRAGVLKSMGRLDEALGAYNTFGREFPNEVFAKTGRAEVFKALGRLDDSLAAYEAAALEFPSNLVAKSGRAAVLCALGRYDETLAALSNESPRTRDDWIAFHIRGMAMLKAGRIDEASKIFLRGSEENPFADDRDVFRNGLALARLHERAYEATLGILSNVREIGSNRVAGFLRGHSAGALGDKPGAARFLSATGPARNERERDLKAELERRFVKSEPPLHDEEWLIQTEVDCFLLAA